MDDDHFMNMKIHLYVISGRLREIVLAKQARADWVNLVKLDDLRPVSTTAERLSFIIVHYRSQCAAQRSRSGNTRLDRISIF